MGPRDSMWEWLLTIMFIMVWGALVLFAFIWALYKFVPAAVA